MTLVHLIALGCCPAAGGGGGGTAGWTIPWAAA